ncbi:SRPBCC family protein [Sphingopyxis sp.]|uniref:SRPBCC family protein n=1 Tax=Sphingopyxis sp. TaxID=1908224 RepID=UPI003BA9F170
MRAVALAAALLVAGPVVAQEAPAEIPVAEPAALAAVPVEVATRTEADGTVTMTHSAFVAAPPAEVWAAVSTPEGWTTWAVPLARWAEGETGILETSYDPAELAGGPGAIWQQFVAHIPGRLLVFRTIKAPDGFPHWDDYKKVTGIFELAPEGEGTRLRLTSTGYPDSEGGRALVAFFAKGNAATLESLQRRFVDGPKVWVPAPAG